jgi:hypothetical protein
VPLTGPVGWKLRHRVPVDEARAALNRPVTLSESHGCIHEQPHDIDDMLRRNYLRKNNRLTVHSYHERVIRFTLGTARPPFELHVYPGIETLCVVGEAR